METFAIRSLDFTYPNMKKKALDNIDLCINEGEFVVICGKSGCGKSTLLKLIQGFYPVENPKYAITVLIEGTEENSKSAIPMFKEICENIKP